MEHRAVSASPSVIALHEVEIEGPDLEENEELNVFLLTKLAAHRDVLEEEELLEVGRESCPS